MLGLILISGMLVSYVVAGFEISAIIFLGLLSLLMIVESIVRIRFCRRQNNLGSKTSQLQNSPKVSIHIAICNEPSELVIKTIRAALQLQYKNYEIIVLDNNTSDKKLWKPVQQFCNRYPEIVTFKHFDKLEGYKAGALNQCLKLMHPDTSYIFTVDADYILRPDSLNKAVQAIDGTDAAVVQFPQHYSLKHERHGLFNELEHFLVDMRWQETVVIPLCLPEPLAW